jgi:hypothetical protein
LSGCCRAKKLTATKAAQKQKAHQHDPAVRALVGVVKRAGHGPSQSSTDQTRNRSRVLTLLMKVTDRDEFVENWRYRRGASRMMRRGLVAKCFNGNNGDEKKPRTSSKCALNTE